MAGDRSGPMVVACIRVADLRPRVDPLSGAVCHDDLSIGPSPADGAALEYAFRVADAWCGHVVVVTIAPASADPVLREAAALGATVIRIEAPCGPAEDLVGDEWAEARAVVAALSSLARPDLVICGDRSADRGTGAMPAFLAHELGAAEALGLVSLDTTANRLELLAERRLDGGWKERLRVTCPAVCSVEGAGVRLRRASLPAILAASEVPVEVVTGPAQTLLAGSSRPFRPRTRVIPAPDSPDPRLRSLALTGALVDHDPPIVVEPPDAAGAADVLISFLVRHGYLPDRSAGPAAPVVPGPDTPSARSRG